MVETCGAWMPRAKETCASGRGHRGQHNSAASVENVRVKGRVKARERYINDLERRESARESVCFRKYGITLADKAAILEAQGGCCAICKRTETNGLGWQVDHYDAADGRPVVRGVLCMHCNTALGGFGHDPVITGRALLYLHRHAPQEDAA